MYAQFFGNYLLSKRAVSTEQLIKAIEEQHTKHTKIGTLAVHMNYMSASQVNSILIRQTHENKRFGEIAIEAGRNPASPANANLSANRTGTC